MTGLDFGRPLALLLALLVPPLTGLIPWPRRWGSGSGGGWLARIALTCSALSLVVALADPGLRSGDRLGRTLVLLDVSPSVPASMRVPAVRSVERALDGGGAARGPILTFGATARRQEPGVDAVAASARDQPGPTDLVAALDAALTLSQVGDRVVLATDGRHGGAGDPLAVAGALGRAGVPLLVRPLWPREAPDLSVDSLRLPLQGAPGRAVRAVVTVRCLGPVDPHRTHLELRHGDAVLARAPIPAPCGTGPQQVVVPLVLRGQGGVLYEAHRGGTGDDAVPENDWAAAVIRVSGPPKALWVGDNVGPHLLSQVLRSDGGTLDTLAGPALVATAADLAAYDVVVLDGVPADDLSAQQTAGLAAYVDNGGGLLVLGGPSAFGAGGYAGSALDPLLPVSSDLRRRGGRMAVVLLIDKSGSMGGREGGWERLLLAKDTLRAMVGSLQRGDDQVGILGFDTGPVVMLPLTPVSRLDFEAVDTGAVQAGGGTDPTRALEAAGLELDASGAPLRQILVITDGRFAGEGVEGEVRRLAARGIGFSAVGVGQRAEMGRLERLATLGRGGVSQVHDARRLPRIVLKELLKASGGLVRRGPVPVRPGSELSGLHPDLPMPPPPLDAINRTLAREGATRWLQSDTGEPILTAWHRGAGLVVALCTDLGGWAPAWEGWAGAAPLARAVLATLTRRTQRPWAASMEPREGAFEITLEAFAADGEPMSAAHAEAELATPEGERRIVPLVEVAPGRYTARTPWGRDGRYRASLRMSGTLVAEAEAVATRSPEFEHVGNDARLLQALAAASGGAIWAADTPLPGIRAEAVDPARGALHRWCLLAALTAFLAYLGLGARATQRR